MPVSEWDVVKKTPPAIQADPWSVVQKTPPKPMLTQEQSSSEIDRVMRVPQIPRPVTTGRVPPQDPFVRELPKRFEDYQPGIGGDISTDRKRIAEVTRTAEQARTPKPPLMDFTKAKIPPMAGFPAPLIQRQPMPVKSLEEARREDPQNPAVGALYGGAKVASALTSRENIAIAAGMALAPPVAAMVASGYFTAEMAKGALETIPEAKRAYDEKRWGDFAELATEAAASGAMAGLAGKHTVKGAAKLPGRQRGIAERTIDAQPFDVVRRERPAAREKMSEAAEAADRFMPQVEPGVVRSLEEAYVDTPSTAGRKPVRTVASRIPSTAKQAAEVFSSEKLPVPRAVESAEVIARTLKTREAQQKAREAKAAVAVPETGIPEQVARTQAERERLAPEVAGKPWGELPNSDRIALDELIIERQQAPSPRRSAERGSFSGKPSEAVPLEENYLNFKRIRVSPEEQANLRNEVKTAVDQHGLDPKAVESHASIIEAAKSIDPELVRHISQPSETGLQTRAGRYAMRQRINSLNKETLESRGKLTEMGDKLTPDEKVTHEREIERKESDLREYIGQWAGIRTADGRNLAMHRMMADSTWDVAYWVDRARRASGLPPGANLPTATDVKIRSIITKGEKAAAEATAETPGVPIDKHPKVQKVRIELAKEMAELDRSGWWETVTAFRKAGLLTGLPTHARNIGGNFAFQAMEEIARIPASIADIVMSTYSKQRTTAGPSMRAVQRASAKAATAGVREMGQVMRDGATPEEMAQMDSGHRELNFQGLGKASKVINTYVNTVFRSLKAEDRLFRTYAAERSLWAQAKVAALNESRAGKLDRKLVERRTKELASKPSEDMALQSIADAEFATFNNKNWIATGVSAARSSVKAAGAKQNKEFASNALLFTGDMIVPFVRTPTNVGARMADYTVGAPAKIILETTGVLSKGLTPERQKAISEAIGRGSTGTGMLLLGYYLWQKGDATGVGQLPPGEQNISEAAGRQAGSIKWNGVWHKVSPFAPVGMLISMGASLGQIESKGTGLAADVAIVGGKALLDQPMLKGTKDVIEGLRNPASRGANFLANTAGSMVPTMVSDVAASMDDKRREYPKTVGEGFASRIPGARQTLPEKKDVFGDPLEVNRFSAIDPFRSSKAKEDSEPWLAELLRLKVGIGDLPKKKGETPERAAERKTERGKLAKYSVTTTMEMPEYKSADDQTKKDMLTRSIQLGDPQTALVNHKAEKYAAEIAAAPDGQRGALFDELVGAGKLDKPTLDEMVRLAKLKANVKESPKTQVLRGGSTHVRAISLMDELNKVPIDQRGAVFDRWHSEGLLTGPVLKRMVEIKARSTVQ